MADNSAVVVLPTNKTTGLVVGVGRQALYSSLVGLTYGQLGATYASGVLSDAPIGYWRLGEIAGTNAADNSGNNHAGTYAGSFTLGTTGALTADVDTAVTLNGTNSDVSIPHTAAFNLTGDLTLECWVFPTSRSNYQMLITKDLSNGSTNNTFELRLEITSGIPNFLQFTDFARSVSATAAPALNQWSHLAVVKSGTTVTHYLNGVANGTGALSGATTTNTRPVLLGWRDDAVANQAFIGGLDEAALYGTALSAARILVHYQAGTGVGIGGSTYGQLQLQGATNVEIVVIPTNKATVYLGFATQLNSYANVIALYTTYANMNGLTYGQLSVRG